MNSPASLDGLDGSNRMQRESWRMPAATRIILFAVIAPALGSVSAIAMPPLGIEAEDCAAQEGSRAPRFRMPTASDGACVDKLLKPAEYRGWKSIHLDNGLVSLEIVPEIGGRLTQFRLGAKEFLWVNPQLAGRLPPESGLAPGGGRLNYGGDKLWPAPQDWDNAQQWPGPPDAVLDGQPRGELGRCVLPRSGP